MDKQLWNLWDHTEPFDLGESKAVSSEYLGKPALYLENMGAVVLSREYAHFEHFRLEAEVAIPNQVGFVGLVFGAQDAENYELVYLAPVEIQYDPIMNRSMTWQIYNGPQFQKPLPNTTGSWRKLAVEVHPDWAAVYLDDDTAPQLVISTLQHGGAKGKYGFWSYLPGYIHHFSIQEIPPTEKLISSADDHKQNGVLTDWLVSSPYTLNELSAPDELWTKASVEHNGTLNINRLYQAGIHSTIQAKSQLYSEEEQEAILTFGFSDELRLWINEIEVYHGSWRWGPPSSDGRIHMDHQRLPIHLKAGHNTVRAELTNKESFGWGLACRLLQDVK
jgi:hypothetical protein